MENSADILEGDVVAPRAAVSIEVTSTPVLSYALAHNRIPVINRLALTSDGPVRGATVRLGVRDAEGPIARAVELLVDLDEGRTTVLTDLGLVMDPAAMLHVEEQRPGVIDVEVELDGELIGEAGRDVQVLAAQQWLATPLPLALEMLAAHVMPNHPAVTDAGRRGGDDPRRGDRRRLHRRLRRTARSGSTRSSPRSPTPCSAAASGTASRPRAGPTSASRCARPATSSPGWSAPRWTPSSSSPPPWSRPASGRCCGWPKGTPSSATGARSAAPSPPPPPTPTPLVNLVDLGLIGLVETTLLTSMGEPGADLHQPAYSKWLTGELDRILGVTDVHRARRDGIVPLPARARDETGVLQVVEYRPALHSAPDGAGPGDDGARAPHRGAGAHPAVEERAARPQPAQPADQLHRARRAGAGRARHARCRVLDNFVHDGTPITLLPADQLAAVQKERGLATARELPEEQLTELLVERREVHADVTTGGYLPRLRNLAYKAKTVQEETGANNLYLALGSLVWELDGRPLRSPLRAHPGRHQRAVAQRRLPAPARRGRREHPELLPAGEAAPAARPRRPDADRDRRRRASTSRRRWRRCASRWSGTGCPTGSRRRRTSRSCSSRSTGCGRTSTSTGPTSRENPLVAHLVHQPTEAFEDPARDTGAYVDLDDLAAAAARPGRLLAAAGDRRGHRRPHVRARGPARHRQVADHHQPAHPGGRRGQEGAVRRREAGGPGRRRAAAGRRRHGHVRPRPARQGLARLDGAGADPAGAGARGRRRRAGPGRRRRRTSARPAACWPATPTGCTTATPPGLSLYSARTAELTAGTDVEPLPVPLPFVANAPAEVLTQVRRALALLPEIADLTRPRRTHPWAFVDTPEIDLLGHPGRGRRGGRGRARADRLRRAVRRAAVRADAGRPRRSGPPAVSGPAVGLDVLDETFTGLWTASTSAVLGEIAAFIAFRHPGLDVATPDALQPAAGRDLRGRADRRGVVLVRAAAPADRRPRPARAVPAAGRDGEAEGRPGAGREPVAGAGLGAGDRGAGVVHPGPVGAGGLEPVRRRRPARPPGRLAAPGRHRRRRLDALPRGAAQADRGRAAGRVGRRSRGGPAAGRRQRAADASARASPDAAGGLGRRRRLRAALVDDPARARRRQLGADVAAPVGLLPRHPRAAALRGPVRRPARCSLQALYRPTTRRARSSAASPPPRSPSASTRPGSTCSTSGRTRRRSAGSPRRRRRCAST